MRVSADRTFSVEIHPTGWHFPSKKMWIAGWIQPGAGQVITDVRARLHHRVVLGLAGLPHPAFPDKSPGEHHSVGAGFSFLFAPHQGATLLRLESCDQSGHWTEFFRTAISTATDAPTHVPALSLSGSLGRLTTALLRQQLRTPLNPPDKLADELMAEFVAEPLDSHPNLPFIGALEEPHTFGRLRYGRISVTGWLIHPTAKIKRLSLIIDPLPAIDLPHGLARGDIAVAFPSMEGRDNSAFIGEIALPVGLAAPVMLKIFAELENGEKHLVFARRFVPQRHDDFGQMPLLISGRDFICAIWALHGAAGRYRLPRTGTLKAARRIWSSYHATPAYGSNGFRRRKTRLPAATGDHPSTEPGFTLIDPADGMHATDRAQYFIEGRNALALVQAAVTRTGSRTVGSILDLPCGFGRVGRWFRTAYPDAKLTVSDTQSLGVDFCVRHLGADGVQANVEGTHWTTLPGPYDVIWCGSLLTHFDQPEWISQLRRFNERLSPQGVLIFTTHGLLALEHLRSGEKDYGLPSPTAAQLCHATVAAGFGYADYAETPGYGISVAQSGWIRQLIDRETELQVLSIHEAAWNQHQDVVVCTRRTMKKKRWWKKLAKPDRFKL